MARLTEEHKRKISRGVKLSRRNFLKGSAAVGLTKTIGGQELAQTTKGNKTRGVLSPIIDSKQLAEGTKLTRRQFLQQAVFRPVMRAPTEVIGNADKVSKVSRQALGNFISPIHAARATSGVKASSVGKLVSLISRVIS